ncbi:MAG: hypothetical protein AUJ52_06595 [Elusimicrobia bacterium CG1_02_63_36]|nr:MAG: hypothetical protein AUJ52_06595 [Elusimicrobia bacterium CG1_02_63_36]
MVKKKRCLYCERKYEPYGRMAKRQKVCGDGDCVAKHKREMDRRWWARRPECRKARNGKKRAWAEGRGYWRENRAKNPEYVERNRLQSRERMRRRREMSRLLRDPAGYLAGLRAAGGKLFANQELLWISPDGRVKWSRRVFANQELLGHVFDGVLRYLAAQAMFANFKRGDRMAWGEVQG